MGARFDQHFLANPDAVRRIVEAAELMQGGRVLEIGPGKGVVTRALLAAGADVTAVEIDPQLAQYLATTFKDRAGFTLLNVDVLKFDFTQLPASDRWVVVGNLPYSITSPILRRLSDWPGWSVAVLMVQKEVGDRICAETGTAAYGALTVGVRLVAAAHKIFDLSRGSFRPPPKVESSVIRLDRYGTPLIEGHRQAERVIQAAFQQRRKMILNALSHGLGITKEDMEPLLKTCDIDPTTRAERISVEQYVRLTQTIRQKGYFF